MSRLLVALAGKRSLVASLLRRDAAGARTFCSGPSENTDYYVVLGIQSSATLAEIKKAYYELTLKFHPDRNEGSVEAATRFRQVTDAYEVLGNYEMRKRYDLGLPLYTLEEAMVVRKHVVTPDVKYQKFFDSRIHKLGAKVDTVGSGSNWNEDNKWEGRDINVDCRPPLGVRFALCVYLCSFLYYRTFICDEPKLIDTYPKHEF